MSALVPIFFLVLAQMAILSGGSAPPAVALAIAQTVERSPSLYPTEADGGRARTAATLAVWLWHEGRWQIRAARGDSGRSVCMAQIMVSRKPVAEWGERETARATALERSPRLCVENALYTMRESLRLCGHLGAYASGDCGAVGRKIATAREIDVARVMPPSSAP